MVITMNVISDDLHNPYLAKVVIEEKEFQKALSDSTYLVTFMNKVACKLKDEIELYLYLKRRIN